MYKIKLSKTQFIKGLQCPLRLWYSKYRSNLISPTPKSQKITFETGNLVGEMAREVFPDGMLITQNYKNPQESLDETKAAIEEEIGIIYEAAAMNEQGIYARIDILIKDPDFDEKWNLIEVKSSTSVKTTHIEDSALQRYAFESAGYIIHKSILMHLNSNYKRNGKLELNKLFIQEDITDEVMNILPSIEPKALDLIKIKSRESEPKVKVGSRCNSPYPCEFKSHCWRNIPEYSIYNIIKTDKARAPLVQKGILEVKDIPFEKVPTSKLIDYSCFIQNQEHKRPKKIKEWLSELNYPLYYLSYQAINPAIPLYDGMGPYKFSPFEFSLLIQSKKGGELNEVNFFNTKNSDFRKEFFLALIESCGEEGSILLYDQTSLNETIKDLSKSFPELKEKFDSISYRIKDLFIPFKNRWLYEPNQKGKTDLNTLSKIYFPETQLSNLFEMDENLQEEYIEFLKDKLEKDKKIRIKKLQNISKQRIYQMGHMIDLLIKKS